MSIIMQAVDSGRPPLVGARIPDVSVFDTEGHTVSLTQLAQQGLMVFVFYQGQWCPWCKAQITTYWRYYNEILGAGLKVAFISVDTPDVSKDYRDRLEETGVKLPNKERSNKIPFPFLCDPDRRATQAFGLSRQSRERGTISKPSVFLVNKESVVTYAKVGRDYADRLSHYELLEAERTIE